MKDNCNTCATLSCPYYGKNITVRLWCFESKQKAVKRHTTAVLQGSALKDDKRVYNALLACASKAGFNVLQAVKHEFYPQGMTAVLVLGESHISIHTYPEDEEAWIDCFTCGADNHPDRYISKVAKMLGCCLYDQSLKRRYDAIQSNIKEFKSLITKE